MNKTPIILVLDVILLVVYVFGGFMTNSYCQLYRYDDWYAAHVVEMPVTYSSGPKGLRYSEYSEEYSKNHEHIARCRGANLRTTLATGLWPFYWASRACTKGFESPSSDK